MTINDPEVTKYTREIQRQSGLIDELTREGKLNALLTLAAKLEDASRKLGWRVLALINDKTTMTLP